MDHYPRKSRKCRGVELSKRSKLLFISFLSVSFHSMPLPSHCLPVSFPVFFPSLRMSVSPPLPFPLVPFPSPYLTVPFCSLPSFPSPPSPPQALFLFLLSSAGILDGIAICRYLSVSQGGRSCNCLKSLTSKEPH